MINTIHEIACELALRMNGEPADNDTSEIHLGLTVIEFEQILKREMLNGGLRPRSLTTGAFNDELALLGINATVHIDDAIEALVREGVSAISFEQDKSPAKSISTQQTGQNSSEQLPGVTAKELIDGFGLEGKDWADLLSHIKTDGRKYIDALVQPGRRGSAGAARFNQVTFARLLVINEDLLLGKVKARFKKTWPELEDEMLAEIGEF